MSNPWMKKNPLLSMWLSGANAIAGSTRSYASAQVKRQAAAMMAEGTKQVVGYWSGVTAPPSRNKRRKTR